MSSQELRRQFCLLSLLLGPAVALAQPSSSTDPAATALTWPELVPHDWDPARSLGVKDLSRVDPDDPKVRKVWDAAPINAHLDGKAVKMLGYLVPLDESAAHDRFRHRQIVGADHCAAPQKASSPSWSPENRRASTMRPFSMRTRSTPGCASFMPGRSASNSISMATQSPLAM